MRLDSYWNEVETRAASDMRGSKKRYSRCEKRGSGRGIDAAIKHVKYSIEPGRQGRHVAKLRRAREDADTAVKERRRAAPGVVTRVVQCTVVRQ